MKAGTSPKILGTSAGGSAISVHLRSIAGLAQHWRGRWRGNLELVVIRQLVDPRLVRALSADGLDVAGDFFEPGEPYIAVIQHILDHLLDPEPARQPAADERMPHADPQAA